MTRVFKGWGLRHCLLELESCKFRCEDCGRTFWREPQPWVAWMPNICAIWAVVLCALMASTALPQPGQPDKRLSTVSAPSLDGPAFQKRAPVSDPSICLMGISIANTGTIGKREATAIEATDDLPMGAKRICATA